MAPPALRIRRRALRRPSGRPKPHRISHRVTPRQRGIVRANSRAEGDRLRAAKSPDYIVAAWGSWFTKLPGVVKVLTADERGHYVTEESYDKRTGLNLLSHCTRVEVTPEQIGAMSY